MYTFRSTGEFGEGLEIENIDIHFWKMHIFDSASGSLQKGVGGLGAQNFDFPAGKCTLLGAPESLVKA